MIKLVDGMDKGKLVEFKSLNEVFLNCMNTIDRTVDENYQDFIDYCLSEGVDLDNITLLRKIREVMATDYDIVYQDDVQGLCNVCGDEGVPCNKVSYFRVCKSCLGLEDRNKVVNRAMVMKEYKKVQELIKDVKSVEGFMKFARTNPEFNCEINGEEYTEFSMDVDTVDLLRVEYKHILVYLDEETFELDGTVDVCDNDGEVIYLSGSPEEFYHEFYQELDLKVTF